SRFERTHPKGLCKKGCATPVMLRCVRGAVAACWFGRGVPSTASDSSQSGGCVSPTPLASCCRAGSQPRGRGPCGPPHPRGRTGPLRSSSEKFLREVSWGVPSWGFSGRVWSFLGGFGLSREGGSSARGLLAQSGGDLVSPIACASPCHG